MTHIEQVQYLNLHERLPYLEVDSQGFAERCSTVANAVTDAIAIFPRKRLSREALEKYFIPAHEALVTRLNMHIDATLDETDQSAQRDRNQRMAQIAFGPLVFPDVLFPLGDIISEDTKVYSASLQHDLALAIVSAESIGNPAPFQEMMHRILLAQSELGYTTQNMQLKRFWAGIRNEVALIHMLRDMNLQVFVPNPLDDEANRIGDVKNSIDVMAVNQLDGTILALNAAATPRNLRREVNKLIRGNVIEIRDDTDPFMIDMFGEIAVRTADITRGISQFPEQRTIVRATVRLPAAIEENWVNMHPTDPDAQTYFDQWARVMPNLANIITESLYGLMRRTDRFDRGTYRRHS